MKSKIKLLIITVVTIIGALLPISGAYWLWSVAMAAVTTVELKIVVSLLMFICGSALTAWMTIICAVLGAILAAVILE